MKLFGQPQSPSRIKITPPGHRRHVLAAATLMLACTGLLGPGLAQAQTQDLGWAKGRLLVLPRAGLSDANLDKIVRVHGGKARRLGHSDLHVVELPANASETAVLNLLARHPHLKAAELDRRVSPDMAANDVYAGSEWHLQKINAPAAWDASQGSGVTIAILDSGVLATHPDLAASLVPGWNFYDNNADTADVYGHGTSVAGAAAAITNNGTGVAGVAGAAKIMPIRITDTAGYGFYSTIASGLIYAADHGARVANVSFGAVYSSATVQSAAQYMKSKGGLVVVAAGNSNANDGAPVSTTMIPVSATDSNDARASWSSYGSYVAVSAPGVGIWSTSRSGGYGSVSGTSFSSPITAGVVALMMARQPSLTASQVESLLYSTATDLGTAGRDIYFGYGRVDAAAAVAAAGNVVVVTPDTQAPSVNITSPVANGTVSGLAMVDVSATDNVGVSRVELRLNGNTVATDTSAPYQFSLDTTTLSNGMASLVAYAFDAAGNSKASTAVSVNVANGVVADTTPPVVTIKNPADGAVVSTSVQISIASTDNGGSAGIKLGLYIDGVLKTSATGGSLVYSWNTRKVAKGSHTIQAVAKDAAGNTTSKSVKVTK